MTAVDWMVTVIGCGLWIFLGWQFMKPDGFFDHEPRRRVCLGCTRYAFRPGCPLHDPELRRPA